MSSRTGALTDATPASRSPTDSTHPRRPMFSSSRTCPADPAPRGRSDPSGTIHRRPCGDCNDSTHRRTSPSRTYNCTLSPVCVRNASRTGRARSTNESDSVAARPSVASQRPRANRPSSVRRTRPCTSMAAASRWVVARGRPARAVRSARPSGPCSRRTLQTTTALSRTPTPDTLSIRRDYRPNM